MKIKEYSELDPRTRLFDSIVVIENYPLDYGLIQTKGKLIAQVNSVFETTNYDLTVAIFPSDRIKVAFLYKKALFETGSIVRMADHFSRIVQEIIENPEKKVSPLEIISKQEKEQILYEFNDTDTDYPKDKAIHELFRQQAGKTPDKIALEGTAASEIKNNETVQLTYSELNQRSDRLAHALREKGIKTDTIAAIMVERSLEMIVGLMGILKSGGAYLPIDPGYPGKRIQYMLTDSNANALVITSTLAKEGEKLRSLEVKGCHETIFIDTLDFSNLSSSQLLNFSTSPSSLAYTIYTSGSTGVPKGVMVEHQNVVNLVFGLQQNIYSQYSENLKVALVAPYVFDASVQQIFAVLLLGRGLILVPEDIRVDGRCLWKFFRKHAVDISDGVPMTLGLMKESGSEGPAGLRPRHFLIGGEALPQALVEDFFKLFNTDFHRRFNSHKNP